MKKIKLGILAALVVVFASCTKQDQNTVALSGDEYQLSVGVQNMTATRADNTFPNTDLTDAGYQARYIVEIYNNLDGNLYKRMEQDNPKFDFRLVKEQKYDFLVWVDYVTTANTDLHYNTADGLKKITMKGKYVNNDASRDAFYYAFTAESGVVANDFGKIVCQRPFGRADIATTDWSWVENQTKLKPRYISVTFDAPKGFNVLSGEATAYESVTYDYNMNRNAAVNGVMALTCDYVFVGGDIQLVAGDITKAKLINFAIKFLDKDKAEITNTQSMLENIPVYRNYITNVKGQLITKQGALEVAVAPEWKEPNVDIEIPDASLSKNIYQALKDKSVAHVDQLITKTTAPATVPGGDAEYTINLNSAWNADGIFTVKNAEGEDYTGVITINITVPNGYTFDRQQLKVNLPNATVVLNVNGKLHADVTVSENTFVVSEGSALGVLMVREGRVEVKGSVDQIARVPESTNAIHVCKIGNATITNWDALTLENNFVTCIDHQFKVKFDAQGGSEVEEQLVSHKGGLVNEPTEPTKADYNFKGWFSDVACTTAWDYTTVVPHNITLFAKWELALIKVTSITPSKSNVTLGGMWSDSPSSEVVTLTVLPENATDKSVTWRSSDIKVVNVDQNGKISFVSGGSFITGAKKATVTATANDGSGVVATIKVETWA